MDRKEVFLTPAGLEKLKTELEHLHNVRRPEVAAQIQRAKELGSTVNNAEYDDAKNQQSFVEGRILTLEQMIKNAVVIHSEGSSLGVNLGSTVTVRHDDGREEHYAIVGSVEVDPLEGKISNESPVGRALLGKKVGEVVKVTVPAGVLHLTITAIE